MIQIPLTLINNLPFMRLYQRWQGDPQSAAFVGVADLLATYGFHAEALQVSEAGTLRNPDLASGQLIHAKCLERSGAREAARRIVETLMASHPEMHEARRLAEQWSATIEAKLAPLLPGATGTTSIPPKAVAPQVTARVPETTIERNPLSLKGEGQGEGVIAETPVTKPRISKTPTLPLSPPPQGGEDFESSTNDAETVTIEAEAGEILDAPWMTLTMARLYAAQGLRHDAVKVYEAVLRREPGNTAARTELATLRAGAASARGEGGA